MNFIILFYEYINVQKYIIYDGYYKKKYMFMLLILKK